MVSKHPRPIQQHSPTEHLRLQKEQHVARGVHPTHPIFIRVAQNSLLQDVDGTTYIDFTSGIGATNMGHGNPFVVDAIKKQVDHYLHTCFTASSYEPYVRVCEQLNTITPGKHAKKTALFTTGAEAVENAIKISKVHTGRSAVVSFEHGFHGRTLMTLSLTAKIKPYKQGFGPFAPEVYKLPYPYLYRRPRGMSEDGYVKQLLKDITQNFFTDVVDPENVACIVMELVTGEGGFLVPPVAYVQQLQQLCKKYGIVFVVDEVQTGFGRTGKLFASEHFGIVPDLLTMAKSLSNGMPLSAVTGKAAIMDSVPEGGLGGTFAGHPVSCAAALASIDFLHHYKLWERADHLGHVIRKRMHLWQERHAFIGDVRGLGAMNAIELVKDRRTKQPHASLTKKLIAVAREHRLLLLKSGIYDNVLRFLPPLTIEDSVLHEGLDIFERVLALVN